MYIHMCGKQNVNKNMINENRVIKQTNVNEMIEANNIRFLFTSALLTFIKNECVVKYYCEIYVCIIVWNWKREIILYETIASSIDRSLFLFNTCTHMYTYMYMYVFQRNTCMYIFTKCIVFRMFYVLLLVYQLLLRTIDGSDFATNTFTKINYYMINILTLLYTHAHTYICNNMHIQYCLWNSNSSLSYSCFRTSWDHQPVR